MRSSCREEILKRHDALRVAISDVLELSYDVLTAPERLGLLESPECESRRLPVPGHALINQLSQHASKIGLNNGLPGARLFLAFGTFD